MTEESSLLYGVVHIQIHILKVVKGKNITKYRIYNGLHTNGRILNNISEDLINIQESAFRV